MSSETLWTPGIPRNRFCIKNRYISDIVDNHKLVPKSLGEAKMVNHVWLGAAWFGGIFIKGPIWQSPAWSVSSMSECGMIHRNGFTRTAQFNTNTHFDVCFRHDYQKREPWGWLFKRFNNLKIFKLLDFLIDGFVVMKRNPSGRLSNRDDFRTYINSWLVIDDWSTPSNMDCFDRISLIRFCIERELTVAGLSQNKPGAVALSFPGKGLALLALTALWLCP